MYDKYNCSKINRFSDGGREGNRYIDRYKEWNGVKCWI